MTQSDRLSRLRERLRAHELDGFLVPRADEHLGEYVAPYAQRLAWLTGFTGSAGLAVVLAERACVFTDGRYTLQLAAQTDPALWERRHISQAPPPAWIVEAAAAGARIGYDPWLFSEDALESYRKAGVALVAVAANPVDEVWQDRPAPPMAPAYPHPLNVSGVPSAEKRGTLAASLREAGQNAAVVSDPASIAWLLNLRGGDVEFTPCTLAFALLHDDARVELFIAPEKIDAQMRIWLGNEVTVAAPSALPDALAQLAGKRVRCDAAGSPAWFAQTLRAVGAEVVGGNDPCLLPKACKNTVEQDGARAAHTRDAVAVCQFLHLLAQTGGVGLTEQSAADRLLAFRNAIPGFRGESFPAISGAGEHGAIIHYRVSPETDRPLRPDEVYLIDSGAQYNDGTTDITRTIWTGPAAPPDALRERFTRVLKGMIAIATLIFPAGLSGAHIDAFARRALWQVGLDYDHGTGHGVGSYLSVHEGPAGISRTARPIAFAPGMILSDEPGFYLPGAYGIRLENLLMVQSADLPDGSKPFLRFETLTLAPFDRRLIAPALLTHAEREWLDAYHARVLHSLAPLVDADVKLFLVQACADLPRT
jgi:Xaa-Pro aminopeptidase